MAMASMLFRLRLLDPSAAERFLVGRRSRASLAQRHVTRAGAVRNRGVSSPPAAIAAIAACGDTRGAVSGVAAGGYGDGNGVGDALAADTLSELSLSARLESSRRSSEFSGIAADDEAQPARHSLPAHGLTDRSAADGALSSHPPSAMSRATAPTTPASRRLDGCNGGGGDDGMGSVAGGGWHSGATARRPGGGRSRRVSLDDRSGAMTLPRLRRVATVCGGDRFEYVQQQANELLQLLLVMDVDRSGTLSYDEWARGVLSLPDVLACFQLVVEAATPGRSTIRARLPLARGVTDAAVLRPAARPLSDVGHALWWRSLWGTMARLGCASCS